MLARTSRRLLQQVPEPGLFGFSGLDGTTKFYKLLTFAGLPVIGMVGYWNYLQHMAHHHEHEEHDQPAYDYLHNRAKAFPWKNGQCAFFDLECHREANAARGN